MYQNKISHDFSSLAPPKKKIYINLPKFTWKFQKASDRKNPVPVEMRPVIWVKRFHVEGRTKGEYNGPKWEKSINFCKRESYENWRSQGQSTASFSSSFFNFFTCCKACFKSILSSGKSEKSFKNCRARAAPLDASPSSISLFRLDPSYKSQNNNCFHHN